MKFDRISYSETVGTNGELWQKIGIEGTLHDGEDPQEAIAEAKAQIRAAQDLNKSTGEIVIQKDDEWIRVAIDGAETRKELSAIRANVRPGTDTFKLWQQKYSELIKLEHHEVGQNY